MKMKRGTVITVLVALAFAALLLYNTLSAQKVACTVCVEYNGRRNCATASHESPTEATRSAQSTACGPLVHGMNDAIACGNIKPATVQCRGT
jgi:hypothetical protein